MKIDRKGVKKGNKTKNIFETYENTMSSQFGVFNFAVET
jgi:hypothetical protein